MENNELMMEATTPTEEAATEPTATEETETTPTESEETTAAGEETNTETDATVPEMNDTLPLRFNHEDINVTREEAIRLAQMGKHYEENLKQMFDDLDYFATLQGKNVRDVIKGLVDGVENSYRDELTEQFGADNPIIEEMLELRRGKNKKTYEDAKADRETREKAAEEEAQKSVATRLAEQFESIRETFPEYDSIEKVPDSVFKRAMKSGDLEKELLRFELSERNKIEAAKASEEKNKKQNIGSVQSIPADESSLSAFMKGLWG